MHYVGLATIAVVIAAVPIGIAWELLAWLLR